MAGRGELSNLPKMDISRLYVMRNGRYQPLFRPVNPDRSFAGFNLAESFAEKYAKKYGVDVPIRVDHVPTMAGETSSFAGYDAMGRLFAIGYLKGILEANDALRTTL